MARNNYGFQKRSRELAKKKKKEEKRLRKQARSNPEAVENAAEGEGQTDVVETLEGADVPPTGDEAGPAEAESER